VIAGRLKSLEKRVDLVLKTVEAASRLATIDAQIAQLQHDHKAGDEPE
jgi:hypothetical protein